MDNQKAQNQVDTHKNTFHRRNDFYWKSIAIYSMILIVYSLIRGSFGANNTINVVVLDPVVILLAIFILVSTFSLIMSYYKNLSISINKDSIIFKTRNREKIYKILDIDKIAYGREKLFRRKGVYGVIKIKLMNRRRILRIRPSSFWEERALIASLGKFKKDNNK